jgi:prolyl oligopeptidase PreP (S9A serine peptidase family)
MKFNKKMRCVIFLGCLGIAFAQPPPTPKRPVVDTYHGVKITDDYRWLESDSDPNVKAWSNAQNAAARRFLDAVPARAALFAQLSELHRNPAPFWWSVSYRGGSLFALKTFNVTEFGTVKEADQFRALDAYSPYHHVVDGRQYPPVLFLTGANDPRVEPLNSPATALAPR